MLLLLRCLAENFRSLMGEKKMQENDDMIATLLEHPLNMPRFTPLTREEVHTRLWSGKTSEVKRQELGPPVVSEERPSPGNRMALETSGV